MEEEKKEKRKYKILVVDDEPDLERLVLLRMRREVRSGMYEFVFAHNGVEALDVLGRDRDIDMVLSDINMPQMDGLTLLEQIPTVDPDLRAVIISAYGDMKNIRTAMNRGAFDFIIKPIDFEDFRVTIARTLSHMAMLRDALASRDKLVALQNELGVANTIQQSILPTQFPDNPDYQIDGHMVPARGVGGDFFDVVRLDRGRVGLAVADVSDKGVPAALFMMLTRTLLKGAAIGGAGPGGVLKEVNRLLHEDNDTAMFVTVFYAIFDPSDGTLVYANGGHNPPLLVHGDGRSDILAQTGGIALGLLPDNDYAEQTVALEPGEAVVMYTDGVTEAVNGKAEEFGMERLQGVFGTTPHTNAQDANRAVFQAVSDFTGDTPQFDDITGLTLYCKGRGGGDAGA